ncbi:MAG: DNA translocase FtsK 4TM domain-containing protein [Coriobacteriia bacterium]
MARTRVSDRRAARPRTPSSLATDARREICGIALCAFAIALLIGVLTTSTAVIPRYVSLAMRLGFGVGAFGIPVGILLWGVSFFVRGWDVDEARVGGGIALVALSVVAMVALRVDPALQWERDSLMTHGGWAGAGVAWALRSLLGTAIAYVTLTAASLIGLVVAGLSVAGLVGRVGSLIHRPAPSTATPERSARRGTRTVPLEDLEPEAGPLPPARRKARGDAEEETDPEARRKTLPTTRVVAPMAMEGFDLPRSDLLARSPQLPASHKTSDAEQKQTSALIEQTLATFDIAARVVDWIAGPTVTMFEVQIAKGIKVNRVTALADDITLALAAPTIRILAPIPGKSYIGIEVPNERRSTVTLGDVLAAPAFAERLSPLLLGIGKDVSGESVLADLAAMPHLLIAGSTGTGKSVCINALLVSILMRATPAEVRLILIDPKRIELSLYNGVPHLYVPVVTEPREAASALAWAVQEMESRLRRLQGAGARNIAQFNLAVHEGTAPEGAEAMPYIVIVIDELADLMMVAAKEVEDSICRLAQLARAAGIHLIVATQRPSTDIITGLIKTNITHRIAFAVGSGIDSRVILDQNGAEQLVGLGDMLFSTPAWPKPKRIQGAYVSEGEIEQVVAHLRSQSEPEYHEEILHLRVATPGSSGEIDGGDDDPLLWEAADIVVTSSLGSTSLLQRRLKVGYARAGRMMDMLESKGIVGAPDGSKPREVLVDIEGLESVKAFERRDREQD